LRSSTVSILALLLGLACLTDKQPPDVQITYPPNGMTVGPVVSITADATDNKGVVKVNFYIDGALLDSSKAMPFGCTWHTTALHDSTAHTIYAKAYDAAKNEGMSSVITVTLNHGNRPPEIDHLQGPSRTRPDSACQSLAYADDLNGDSVAVRFDWGDGATSDWSAFKRSGDSTSTSHSWSATDTFSVRAQAKDAPGATSQWSDPLQVVVSGSSLFSMGGVGRIPACRQSGKSS
jgi:hypothetical protein